MIDENRVREYARERTRTQWMAGATAIVGILGIVGGGVFAGYLQSHNSNSIRECIESVGHHTPFPTDLCEDRCFRDNYLRMQQEYGVVKDLGLTANVQELVERIADVAYKKAADLCK